MPIGVLQILFADDDPDVLRVAPEDLRATLADRGIEAKVSPLNNVPHAIEQLRTKAFHLAVVDLKFPASPREGNAILRMILETQILPIIVYSGYPDELDEPYKEHGLIFVTPSKQISDVVRKIEEWHGQRVFEFFSQTGFLSSTLRTVLQQTMWKHVSRYWKYLGIEDPALLARTAGRIAATLLHDALTSSPEYAAESGEVPIHHGEIYIFTTPRTHLAVGDILKLDHGMFVVLTPACDLVERGRGGAKAQVLLLAECQDLASFASLMPDLTNALNNLNAARGTKKRREAEKHIERMMRHSWLNEDGRHFFLPPFAVFKGGVIDFLKVWTEPHGPSDRQALMEKRVLSINREASAELSSRFARYMIRLGQAPYETSSLFSAIKQVTEPR